MPHMRQRKDVLYMDKKALLVISFGTSFEETRRKTIDAIENELRQAFPERRFYRAWTSGMIRRKLRETESTVIPSVQETLEQMERDGVTDVLVQPTHLLLGAEYVRTEEIIHANLHRFETVAVGAPLLCNRREADHLAKTLEDIYAGLAETDMLVLMGHGSAQMVFPAYEEMARQFRKDGHENICLGTVEFTPGIEPVLTCVRQYRPERVFLAPLLLVAGDHAANDMAGDRPDSWKNQLAALGPQVICCVKGLGEYPAVRAMYVRHAMRARNLS